MTQEILRDALLAAIAAIGFASISRPPARAYFYCGLIAAVAHSLRMVLMSVPALSMHIVAATVAASFVAGCLAVMFSPAARTPAEACLFPALLPMIPGMFAYRTFGALARCMVGSSENAQQYVPVFFHNALMCAGILTAMVIGATVPIFIFKKTSFRATR